MTWSDALVYFELDTIGNVRHLHTDATVHGSLTAKDLGGYSYTAFGKTIAPSDVGGVAPPVGVTQPFGWQGKRLIAPNLYDSRARVWSADLGAFLQPDEYVFLGRSGTLWSWPGQNPYRWRDPSGRGAAESLAGEIINALVEFAPTAGGAANDNAIAAEEAGGLTPLGAALLAAGALGAFADQVQGLGQEIFEQQDANANAIARATAAARLAAGGAGEPPDGPDCDKGKTHGHHSDPKFLGGDPKQPLTEMSAEEHQNLHSDLNDFLEGVTDEYGNNMRPTRGNSGRDIQRNFTRTERLDALSQFYRGLGAKYGGAASDFFAQHPGL